jgi:hypothetical protein
VARADCQSFDCAPWVHKARELPREEFRRVVEQHVTGKESEPWELLYFKVYKSQLPIIERALETVGLMLGTDKSRGYCNVVRLSTRFRKASLQEFIERLQSL